MNKFLKTILIILGVCALMYLALVLFATKDNMDQIDDAKKSMDKSTIYGYIDEINLCLVKKYASGESNIPSVVTDKNFCTDSENFRGVEFEKMENLELNLVNNEVANAIITYNGVTYSYDSETNTLTVK